MKKHQHDIEQLQQKNKEQMEEIKATRDKLRLVEQVLQNCITCDCFLVAEFLL